MPVLAKAIQLQGICGHDAWKIPQPHAANSAEAAVALSCLRDYQAAKDNPGPRDDYGFEQEDSDWPAYRYGWYDNALPDFKAIEVALVPPPPPSAPPPSLVEQGAPATPINRFLTLHDLLTIDRVSPYDLELTIREHGVWEIDWPEQYFEDPIHVAPEEKRTFQTIVALGAFLIDRYKGRDAGRTLLGPHNPLYHFGWPQSELAKISFTDHHEDDRMGAVVRLDALRPLFDPKFITVGRLLITGQATVGQITRAVEQHGVQGRLEHNVARWYETKGDELATAVGPIWHFSELLKPFAEYEVSHRPVPEQLYHDPALLKWGWEPEVLPAEFRDPAYYGDSTALPKVVPAHKPMARNPVATSETVHAGGTAEDASTDSDDTEENDGGHEADTPRVPGVELAIHPKTKNSYLALIGVLLDIIQYNEKVYGFDKKEKQYAPRKDGEEILDADIIYTIKERYAGLKNIRETKYKLIMRELALLHEQVPEIFSDARQKVVESHLSENEKRAQRKKKSN